MHADAVVEQLDILKYRGACGFVAFERFVVGQFQLERDKETLSHGIVVRDTRPTHAQLDFRGLRFCPVVKTEARVHF